MTTALEVRNLSRHYGPVPALQELTLSLRAGQIVALFGENGSGKTTLLKIVAGLLAEYTGEVLIHGQHPGPASKAMISFLPDESFLPNAVTARQAAAMFADFFADFDAGRAASLIAGFEIDPNRQLKSLSKGQREKVQLALAMSRRAKVYLLDEPISGVDPAARETILNTILSQYDPAAVVVISTHLLAPIERVAAAAVGRHAGRVALTGDADDLRAQHGMSLDQLFRSTYQIPVRS